MSDDDEPQPDGEHDAHVRVLTAEVRTLMVGSRQVTLSVYNQLDFVPYDQIEPFGRVNPRDAEHARVYVVGRSAEGGSLVRAVSPRADHGWHARAFTAESYRIVNLVLATIPEGPIDYEDAAVTCALRACAMLVEAGNDGSLHDAIVEGMMRQHPGASRHRLSNRLMDLRRDYDGDPLRQFTSDHETRAADAIHARDAAIEKEKSTAEEVKNSWSELPLIVLAGLR